MTPSATIIASQSSVWDVTDSLGRTLSLRHLTALDKLRLFKAAGPELAQNSPWLGIALLACSVAAIDNVPVPAPVNESQIEAMVSRLGDAGLDAVSDALDGITEPSLQDVAAIVGNSRGTPI